MKHAIIVTGGKQYRVAEGDVVFIEKLDAAAGDSVKFDQVLAVIDGENAVFGKPRLDLGARHIQHRAQKSVAHRRDAAESAQACAARELQQERLSVVVGGMRRRDPPAAGALGAGTQKRITRRARFGLAALNGAISMLRD